MQLNAQSTSFGERLSFGLYSFGTILVYYLIASFLQLYLTNIGIAAVTVGVVFLISKVWDAVNDPIFGVMVDKVSFKKGRYKPWLKIASVAIPVATVLLFVIPSEASVQVKIIWAMVAYVLWDTAYTMCDVPVNALATAMTENLNERNKLYALAAFFVYLGGLLIAVAVPMMFPTVGWGVTSILISLLAFLTMLPLQFKTKERFLTPPSQDVSIGDLFKFMLKNKYLLIFTAATVIGAMTNFATTLAAYFAIHCLGSEGWITPIALATAVPVLFVSLIVPKLYQKMDKFKAMILFRILSIVMDFCIYFTGYGNTTLLLILIAVKQLFFAVWAVSGVMFIADCIEYGQFKNGRRAEGISFSIKAFTNKLVIALSGSLGMFALGVYGFVEGQDVTQSAHTVNGIWTLYAFSPIIGSVISVTILLIFYKLRDKDVQIMTRCNNGELSRAEAESQLSRPF